MIVKGSNSNFLNLGTSRDYRRRYEFSGSFCERYHSCLLSKSILLLLVSENEFLIQDALRLRNSDFSSQCLELPFEHSNGFIFLEVALRKQTWPQQAIISCKKPYLLNPIIY